MNLNSVVFKGTPDGILILLDEKTDFFSLKHTLIKKLKDNSSFFKEATTSITFKGKALLEEEELELIKIISKYSEIEISSIKHDKTSFNIISTNNDFNINTSSYNIQDYQQKSSLNFKDILKSQDTYFHKGSIRGGQCINYNGSIVIIGDVNPGSKIIAEGNIIVLGKLKGIAHAGCNGQSDCFVFSLFMNPTQLIINDIITYFPENIKRDIFPEYAYAKNGKIFVEQLIKF